MRQFFILLNNQILQAMPTKLNWSQICELLPLRDINEINYYMKICLEQNLSYRKLREKIKSEYICQIKKYMNYIDKNIKSINQDNTIGIIICRRDNKFIMEYCSDPRIFRTIYELV